MKVSLNMELKTKFDIFRKRKTIELNNSETRL